MKGTDMDAAEKLLNFMLEPKAAIAVAVGQKYPPSLDPTKVAMPEEVKKLPAFDPTGKLKGYLFRLSLPRSGIESRRVDNTIILPGARSGRPANNRS